MADARAARVRPIVAPASVPELPRYVRLRFDERRRSWVILAPERVLNPDETAVAVLRLVDGRRSVGVIAEELAKEYDAPAEAIAADIVPLLQDLVDRGVVRTIT